MVINRPFGVESDKKRRRGLCVHGGSRLFDGNRHRCHGCGRRRQVEVALGLAHQVGEQHHVFHILGQTQEQEAVFRAAVAAFDTLDLFFVQQVEPGRRFQVFGVQVLKLGVVLRMMKIRWSNKSCNAFEPLLSSAICSGNIGLWRLSVCSKLASIRNEAECRISRR